jgi:hypothetical protein
MYWAQTVDYILDKGASDARAALAYALGAANCISDAVRTLQRAIRDRPQSIVANAHSHEERDEFVKLNEMRNNLAQFEAAMQKTGTQRMLVRDIWGTSTGSTGHILMRPYPWCHSDHGHTKRLPETVDSGEANEPAIKGMSYCTSQLS